MKNRGYKRILILGIVALLFASQLVAIAEEKKSPIKIGGAMRMNYIRGSYTDHRGEKIGDVALEIFRLNADINFDKISSRLEYRWYPGGYSMIHTAWLGYNLGDLGTLKAGVVRVPFGPGPYGVSSSWFFDQHFYVGLADDMDLGIRWSDTLGKLTLDVGYYLQSEPQTLGDSLASSRYSYDIVRWYTTFEDEEGNAVKKENGFDEQHQLNLRAIYALENIADLGVSLQYGLLKGTDVDDDGANHYAFSAHMKNAFAGFTLFSQFSYYAYNITDDLIPMGAYDYPLPIASKGLIPALSLRYGGIDTSGISWIDSVTPYVEASTILKTVEDFNNSTMAVLGASWTLFGALYLYSDLALSDGNYFAGSDGDFGANENNAWNWRANVNFGYYF